MAVTAFTYTKFVDSLASKKATLSTDTIKCLLFASYTPAQNTHQYVSDVKAAGTEASGTGYTAGGATLTSVTWSQASNVYKIAGTIPAWNASGGSLSAAYAVFADTTPGSDATNPVICYWDLGGTQTATNGTFTLTASGSGLTTFTVS